MKTKKDLITEFFGCDEFNFWDLAKVSSTAKIYDISEVLLFSDFDAEDEETLALACDAIKDLMYDDEDAIDAYFSDGKIDKEKVKAALAESIAAGCRFLSHANNDCELGKIEIVGARNANN